MKKLKDLVSRSECVLSYNSNLEHLYTFKNFPVFMGTTNQPLSEDEVADMVWFISPNTGTIQLNPLIPLSVLYADSHGSGSVGKLWDMHHREFANFIHRFNPKAVLEIGGGHGMLAKNFLEMDRIAWTILEPNPTPVTGCKADFIRGFFDDKFTLGSPVDTVVHSHVLEHIYKPDQFMTHLSNFIKEGDNLIFSLPNMRAMLERNYTNCVNFEHTVFLSEDEVEYLLAQHGFRIVVKEHFREEHSVFYSTVRDSATPKTRLTRDLYRKNKDLFCSYIRHHENLIRNLNQQITSCSGQVFLFGAHVFAQYLIAFGLDTSRIAGILDNDPHKQGNRLSGTELIVKSPKILTGLTGPSVILKAGVYNEEIKSDILTNINSSTLFLE